MSIWPKLQLLSYSRVEPVNSGNYIPLSNIYAASCWWDGVSRLRAMIREQQARKNKGSSWTELGDEVHEFIMGHWSHSDSEKIYFISFLRPEMKFLGYYVGHENEEVLLPSKWPPNMYSYNMFEVG